MSDLRNKAMERKRKLTKEEIEDILKNIIL